jgi:major vault protein
MSNETRERDLVLAPNEYAFISDQTKGNINVYVGPYKTSLANTDKPVIFDEKFKKFVICNLETAIQTFTTAPEGWYIVLKNPSMDGKQPKIGTSNSLPELNIGRKVNIPGPISFALWSGQMAKVIKGHYLRSNQYLVVRVYDEEEAKNNWAKSVIKTKEGTDSELLKEQINDLTIGKQLIIKGTSVSFYIPPTGVEVVRTHSEVYVREAVTLERMEYCILLDENGNKRFVKGPDVVFPEPTEEFVEKKGQRKFKAIELNEISGLYIKVIAPYQENEISYKEGQEIFITGKEQMIYYPRPEHAIIKYGEQDKIYAIAIPKGEGRYYLNRITGVISLKQGPCMFLPDPRTEVLVRRIIEPHKVRLWYPGNEEAVEYNNMLIEMTRGKKQSFLEEQSFQLKKQKEEEFKKDETPQRTVFVGDAFERGTQFTPPRTLTIDTKYEGAVCISVWNGYAVQVISKTGERKVLKGPISYLLEYDEDLQSIELSTGVPKTEDKLIKTVYLRTLNNKVSDIFTIESSDFCQVNVLLSYRLNFTNDENLWFNVENYVKFLTEHLRSRIRNTAKKRTIMELFNNGTQIIRDHILGEPVEGKRAGLYFEENGMHIYDVEVLDIKILDKAIEKMLIEAQQDVMSQELAIAKSKRHLDYTTQKESIDRAIAELSSVTLQNKIQLEMEEAKKQTEFELAEIRAKIEKQKQVYLEELEKQQLLDESVRREIERKKLTQELALQYEQEKNNLQIQMIEAHIKEITEKAGAISPNLIAALQAFSDKALAEKMAQSMAPLAILGGSSVIDVLKKLLKGTKIENVLGEAKDA